MITARRLVALSSTFLGFRQNLRKRLSRLEEDTGIAHGRSASPAAVAHKPMFKPRPSLKRQHSSSSCGGDTSHTPRLQKVPPCGDSFFEDGNFTSPSMQGTSRTSVTPRSTSPQVKDEGHSGKKFSFKPFSPTASMSKSISMQKERDFTCDKKLGQRALEEEAIVEYSFAYSSSEKKSRLKTETEPASNCFRSPQPVASLTPNLGKLRTPSGVTRTRCGVSTPVNNRVASRNSVDSSVDIDSNFSPQEDNKILFDPEIFDSEEDEISDVVNSQVAESQCESRYKYRWNEMRRHPNF